DLEEPGVRDLHHEVGGELSRCFDLGGPRPDTGRKRAGDVERCDLGPRGAGGHGWRGHPTTRGRGYARPRLSYPLRDGVPRPVEVGVLQFFSWSRRIPLT